MFPGGYFPKSYFPNTYFPSTIAVVVHGSGGGGVDTKGFEPWNKKRAERRRQGTRQVIQQERFAVLTVVIAIINDLDEVDQDTQDIFEQGLVGSWQE